LTVHRRQLARVIFLATRMKMFLNIFIGGHRNHLEKEKKGRETMI